MSADPMPIFAIKAKDNLSPLIVGQYVRALCDQGLFDQARREIRALIRERDEAIAERDAARDRIERALAVLRDEGCSANRVRHTAVKILTEGQET